MYLTVMCWIGKVGNKKIADRDILVYKILTKCGNTISAPYFNAFTYKLGSEYSLDKKIDATQYKFPSGVIYIYIHEGFHCFNEKCIVKRMETSSGHFVSVTTNNEDFYGKNLLRLAGTPQNEVIVVKCIIKKGTEYYENKAGEIVTEKLYLEKMVMPSVYCRKFKNLN